MLLNHAMAEKESLLDKHREYINRICERLNISYTELARKSDLSQSTITRLFKDKINHTLSAVTLDKIARNLKVEPFGYSPNQVHLIGRVEALAKVVLYPQDQQDMVDAPPEAVQAGAVALEVLNDDNWPVYKAGEKLYLIESSAPINPKLDYYIEMENGDTLIRMIQPGTFEGAYTLLWHNAPPITNVKIRSARPIKWTKKF
jgi:transcriptional regulator with XRE-family HTH domain